MAILLFIALALVLVTALDAHLEPGSTQGRRSASAQRRADGRRNPQHITPRRRSRHGRRKQTFFSGQLWLS